MKCPRDGTPLARVSLAGIDLDKCHKCDGIWFDRGELEQLRDAKLTDAEELLEKQYGDPDLQKGQTDGYMRCPRCGADARLLQITYTYMNPVRIDRCENCLGVWLDDSELNAVIGEKKQLDEEYSIGRLRSFLRGVGRMMGT